MNTPKIKTLPNSNAKIQKIKSIIKGEGEVEGWAIDTPAVGHKDPRGGIKNVYDKHLGGQSS